MYVGNEHSVAFNPIRDTLFGGDQLSYDLWGMANSIATSIMMPLVNNYPQVGHLSNEISSNASSSIANIADDVSESISREVNVNPSEIAKSWQGAGKYHGIDDYSDVTVTKGTILYRGEPNGTEYFTTLEAIERSDKEATKIFEGLQVEKNLYMAIVEKCRDICLMRMLQVHMG